MLVFVLKSGHSIVLPNSQFSQIASGDFPGFEVPANNQAPIF